MLQEIAEERDCRLKKCREIWKKGLPSRGKQKVYYRLYMQQKVLQSHQK